MLIFIYYLFVYLFLQFMPLHFFVLTEAKKVKTVPASLEKLALKQLNRPNSIVPRSNKDDY